MKKRVCFTVSDESLKQLKEIAKIENRSASSMIEILIQMEVQAMKKIGAMK
jgi:predicted transcriptional regulator